MSRTTVAAKTETQPVVNVHETESEDNVRKPSAEDVYKIADENYEFVRDTLTGDLYAVNKDLGFAEPLTTNGTFRNRIIRMAQVAYGKVPRSQSVTEAIQSMQGQAMEELTDKPIHLRMARVKDKVWIDVCDDDDTLILLHDGSVTITDNREFGAPTFRRSSVMEKLPVPGAYKTFDGDHKDGEYGWKKSLGYLWQIVNVPPEYRMLLLAWLIHTTINEATAFPLLLVQAEQGSGKSWLLHILSRLIDPSRDTGGGLPANEDAFAVSALNSRLLLFDNLSRIPPQKSDLLCRASTGGTIRRRKLYTDATEGMYNIMRPIIITGINVGTVNPDLAERLVRIEMRRPDNRNRRSLSELKRLWSDHATDIYMGLLRLAAQVSDNLHIYTNEELPRMADFGVVCRALDDLCHVHVFDRYVAQQQSIAMEMVSDEPVFLALQQNRLMFATAVEVTSGELLRRLQPTLSLPADQLGTWKSAPKSAADLTRSLDICAPALRDRGWNVSWTKGTGNNSGSRLWTLKAPSENQ